MTGHKGPPARLHPLARSITLDLHGSRGLALLELLLAVGVLAVATAGITITAKVVDTKRKVGNEVRHAQEIAEKVNSAYLTSGDYAFTTLNQENAKRDKIFPAEMLNDAGDPKAWDGDVLLAGAPVAGLADMGAALIYTAVPTDACVDLVSGASKGFYGVSINDTPVRDRYSAISPQRVVQLCNQGPTARVQFLHAKHGGAVVAAPSLSPCIVPPPLIEEVVNTGCPTGQLGTRTYRTEYHCPSSYGGVFAGPAALVSDTCTPACVLPSPATQSSSENRTGSRTLACPTGQLGAITQSGPETRTQTRQAVCETPPGYTAGVGPYTWTEWSPWSPWSDSGPWSTVSDTCAPACVAPAPTTAPETRITPCPSGTLTTSGQSSFSQTAPATTTYSCPAPTGPAASTTTYGTWSPSVASSCFTACTAPPTETTPATRPAPPETRTLPCPPEQAGAIQQSRSRQEFGTTTTAYSCPAPTGSAYASTSTAWSGNYDIISAWTTTSNTCAPICGPAPANGVRTVYCPAGSYGSWWQSQGWDAAPAPTCWTARSWTPTIAPAGSCINCPAPATQTSPVYWAPVSGACPAGQTGSRTWESAQTRTRTVYFDCPAGTLALPGESYGPWSPYSDTGTTRNLVNNCTPICGPAPANGYRSLACPSGQVGSIEQTHTWSAAAAPTCWTANAWATTSNTCTPACVAPAPTTGTATRNGSCPFGTLTPSGASSFTQTSTYTTSYYCPNPTGPYAAYAPTYGTWSPSEAQACAPQCVAPAPTSSATTRPAPNEGQSLACPTGYTGERYEERTRVENGTVYTNYGCPAPTGSWSSWNSTTWHGTYTITGAWTLVYSTCTRTCTTTRCQEF